MSEKKAINSEWKRETKRHRQHREHNKDKVKQRRERLDKGNERETEMKINLTQGGKEIER